MNKEKSPTMGNSNLLFDFTVDKAAKTVFIKREFAADLSLVWDAFTKAEILDQWNAPAPYTAKTKYMNFEVGGKRFYAMVKASHTSESPAANSLFINTVFAALSTVKSNSKSFFIFSVFYPDSYRELIILCQVD